MMSHENHVIEDCEFHLAENAGREEFLAAFDDTQGAFKEWDGVVDRALLQDENGTWLDLIHWVSPEASEEATPTEITIESFESYFSFVEEASVEHRFFDTVRLHLD